MKKYLSKIVLAATFSLSSACGGGGGGSDDPADERFSGVWQGTLAQVEEEPAGCDGRLKLNRLYSVEVHQADKDGNTITLTLKQSDTNTYEELVGFDDSDQSFRVSASYANILDVLDKEIIFEGVLDGHALVTYHYARYGREGSCSSTFKGEMVR